MCDFLSVMKWLYMNWYGLIFIVVNEYGKTLLEPELRPEFIGKMKTRQKEKFYRPAKKNPKEYK